MVSDAAGTSQVATAPDGTYSLRRPPGFADLVIGGCDQDQYVPRTVPGVVVPHGGTVIQDAQLTRYGRISGAIEDAGGACVTAFSSGTPVAGRCFHVDHYDLAVPPGVVTVRFVDDQSPEEIWYDATTADRADPVTVPEDVTVTGIDVDFDLAPVVAVLSPHHGDAVRGPTSLVATATDDVAVTQVEFLVDGWPVGVDHDRTDGWSVRWNPASVADGAVHHVTAVATDTIAQTSTSDVVLARVLSSSMVDFDGDGDTDIGVYRQTTGSWRIRGAEPASFGAVNAIPVPGDYDRDGRTDHATYRPASGQWDIEGVGVLRYGAAGAAPVPADYDGDGDTDVAVFTPGTAQWDIRGIETTRFGQPGAVPVPADYDGDGDADLATYNPTTGIWSIRGVGELAFGGIGAVPVPADYDGDGDTDIATYRSATGRWQVYGIADVFFGGPGETPLPSDYDGDGDADLATYRPATSRWSIRGAAPFTWGLVGDTPLAERH
jgi:hypothetical protein